MRVRLGLLLKLAPGQQTVVNDHTVAKTVSELKIFTHGGARIGG